MSGVFDETKYKKKYRIKSARNRDYDYSQIGSYFVTICTKNRICFFGNIINCEMNLNAIGSIVKNELLKTTKIRKNIEFGPQINNLSSIVRGFKSAVKNKCNQNGYKHFQWQSRFYDRIIRNQFEYERISKYICENPFKWETDNETKKITYNK